VMSLLIASGVSRVQYYFVKVGATLIFSALSFILLVIVPILIVAAAFDMRIALDFLNFVLEIDAVTIALIFFGWLSAFSMLMTSVIISRGRAYTIFVFLGISIVTSQIASAFHQGRGAIWWNFDYTAIIIQQLITIAVMGLIGILILRKQDL